MLKVELMGDEQLRRKLKEVGHQVLPKATARALNTTAVTVRKESVKAVAKRMGLKQKDVRDRTKLKRAKPRFLQAAIEFSGNAFNVIRFKARQTAKGVTAAPWGKRKLFRSAFIATINGTKLVMIRHRESPKYQGRLPIRPMKGPGVAKTAGEDDLDKQRRETVARVLPERMRRELEFQISKIRGRA